MSLHLAAAALPTPVHDPATVRRAAEEILSRPEFADAAPSLLERVGHAVFEALGRGLEAVLGARWSGTAGSVGLLLVVVVVVVVAVRFLSRVRADPARGTAAPTAAGRSAGAWRADAEAHEAAGRWRQAIRCRYRSVVAALDAAGVCSETAGRTAREYQTEVANRVPAVAAPMAGLTIAFERAWYGPGPHGRAAAAAAAEDAAAVLAAVSRSRQSGVVR